VGIQVPGVCHLCVGVMCSSALGHFIEAGKKMIGKFSEGHSTSSHPTFTIGLLHTQESFVIHGGVPVLPSAVYFFFSHAVREEGRKKAAIVCAPTKLWVLLILT